jgi:UDP-glucose 6-dehydrogenase
MRILIIGHGVVGTNLGNELAALNPEFCDKYKGEHAEGSFDIAFVCVDTPRTDVPCDISEVRNAIAENDAGIYVIKSTVLPGTTDALAMETGKRIAFSPEYYGATPHCNNFEFGFTIIGGEKRDCIEVQQALQPAYDARHSFRLVDAATAELAKYMENSWLATKVGFCCQFASIAEQAGVDYEDLRELFILDPRVNPSHTFVYRDHPYWSSHCLDKDVPAIADAFDAPLLDAVIAFNEDCKGK